MGNKKSGSHNPESRLAVSKARVAKNMIALKLVSTKIMIDDLIPIPCTDRATIDKLRSLLIEIQAAWLDSLFDSGLTLSTPKIWQKMQEAVCLLHRRDDISAKGFDLKTIASDYDLLEQIFIAKHWEATNLVLDDSSFVGCDLVRIHHFSAIGILKEVVAFIGNRQDKTIEQRIVDSYPDEETAYDILSKGIGNE